ncbi:GNS1/SUR4 membrane protein [Lasiodiplodia theobromae]|uniref:Elongation of fatty acids protein n=2 Tax=Lasiodiplodia TaxID=66739 RepID=A0A5N5DGA4_9PEZI|nr:Fatty acid elongase [Lasiodiplodia theobromae]KAB2576697.1 Elongation of fatty acids protein 2 [Lasiodiplodia theobromae]KAF4534078.1 Fatty acid elongase [Lasiodiplodia theobromae]KAF9633074.1 GNS1/SUR4 membrane protein [Lasiodiplodia theobromae]KAK0663193.1 Elongation of fatty acids protein 2 [Lasiodiplodia hormozganensis]
MSKPDWIQVGAPTLDHPFGLHLWPIFEKAFETVKGYKPQDFRFVQDETPLSTFKSCAIMLVSYYVIIFGGREVMKNYPALKLNGLFKIHNFYLTAISGILLVLFLEQLIPELVRNGVFHAICSIEGGWTDKLVILYYLNYLTKYLEFIDTMFLFLKKKPLTFLHTYHHGATALLCYTQLIGHTSVSWVPITLNLTVHVVMYWYYFQSARGIRIWWKKYITIMQILQFVLDLGFVYFASWTYFTSTYWPWLPNAGRCAGEEFAAFSGIAILTSYLFLFILFYIATYKKPVPKGRGRAKSALVEMKDEKVPTVGAVRRRLSGASQSIANGYVSPAAAATPNGRVTRSRKA